MISTFSTGNDTSSILPRISVIAIQQYKNISVWVIWHLTDKVFNLINTTEESLLHVLYLYVEVIILLYTVEYNTI